MPTVREANLDRLGGERPCRAGFLVPVLLGAFLALGGCEAPRSDSTEDMPMEETTDRAMPQMEMDRQTMQRHAEEAEMMARQIEDHVGSFRALPPEAQRERFTGHADMVSQMLGLMNRQTREMSMGMQMDDAAMGAMMGMSPEEHRRMMEEMAMLRAEAEELQVASEDELRERMPAHLDRLQAMVGMLEEMAEAMRER